LLSAASTAQEPTAKETQETVVHVTRKSQYALRAIFELARRGDNQPVKAAVISEAQDIPVHFLEVILNQLKRIGFVKSKRGYRGGYQLVDAAEAITVGHIMRSLEQHTKPTECSSTVCKDGCPFIGSCVFLPLWIKAQEAIYRVYDGTTIQDLLDGDAGNGSMLLPEALRE